MAHHCLIRIQDWASNEPGVITLNVGAYESDQGLFVGVSVDVSPADLSSAIEAAIVDAVVYEFQNAHSVTVGVLDRKTFLGKCGLL